MNELGLTAIEITENNTVVRLERNAAPAGVRAPAAGVQLASSVQAAEPAQSLPTRSDDLVCVRSPMVGVFYASSAENAEQFVNVGSKVKKGDIVCIVEAMKLMNEITAEFDGEVVDVCVHNGDVVEYGQTLFKLC